MGMATPTNPRLRSIKAKNFRSFKEMDIEFPDSGLLLLQGKNLDSNGSSRSGKSSINTAIQYALGQAPLSSTQLQSWFAKDGLGVTLEISQGEEVAVVNKSNKSSIKIGEVSTTGAKPIGEALDGFLGISTETLASLTFRPQKSRGFFLNKTDSEKKEFLSSVLGFDKIESALDVADKENSRLNKEAEAEVVRLKTLESFTEELKMNIPPKPEPAEFTSIEQVLQKVEELKAEFAAAEAKESEKLKEQKAFLENFKNEEERALKAIFTETEPVAPVIIEDNTELERLYALAKECQRRLETATLAEEQRRAAFDAEKKAVELEIRNYSAVGTKLANLEKNVAATKEQLVALHQATCPTCAQHWDSPAQIQALETKLEVFAGQEALLQKEAEALEAAKTRSESLVWVPDPTSVQNMQQASKSIADQVAAENKRMADEKSEALTNFIKLKSAYESRKEEALVQIQKDRRHALEAVQRECARLREATIFSQQQEHAVKKQLEETKRKNDEEMATYRRGMDSFEVATAKFLEKQKQVVEVQAVVEEKKRSADLEKDFQEMIGRTGFLGHVFEEILDEVSTGTNGILQDIPNVDNVLVNFASETVTQKGTAKKSIKTEITVGEHQATLEGLSGGQQTAVELAVDLALLDVVSNRSGLTPGWLVLDESFEGLDMVSKEACLEILKKKSDDRLIIVVDHANEFKEMFSQVIEVSYKDGVSDVLS